MCDCKECCCEEEVEEEIITKEDIVDSIFEGIENGNCIHCGLELLFDIAYDMGKKDLAAESMDYYKDVLEEEI